MVKLQHYHVMHNPANILGIHRIPQIRINLALTVTIARSYAHASWDASTDQKFEDFAHRSNPD